MGKDLKGKELGTGLSQRKDGKYSARFRSKSGKRIEKYFDKLPEAKRWLRQAQYDDEHSNIAASSDMTVDAWFDVWFKQKKQQVRKSTYERYAIQYKNCIQEYIGQMIISDVRPIHCQNIINELNTKGLKPSSIELVKIVLKMIFQCAVDNQIIQSNPVKVQLPKKEKMERRVLTKSEQSLFLEYAKKLMHYNTYAFVLQTGLRCGEVTGLKWSDIDFKKRIISISRSVNYDKDEKRFIENPTKTESGKRTIPLTETAYQILIEQKKANEGKPIVLGYHEYVFLNSKGNPINRVYYDKNLYSVSKVLGIESFSMHTLRHTFATRCIESGMKPKTLQKILGHSKISMTMDLYVHVTEDEMAKEMMKFENMINNVKAM